MADQDKSARGGGYDVGFAKPPKETQFKKGQSGNPKGRPKGRANLATTLEKALLEKVSIVENGRRKSITKLEAAVKQLVNKSAGGDLRAFRMLSALVETGEHLAQNAAAKPLMKEADLQVLERIRARMNQASNTTEDHPKESNHEPAA